MNLLKLVFLNLIRNWQKSIIIFFIIFLISFLTATSLSISNAISVTRDNLKRQIPPIATINKDNDAIAEVFVYGEVAPWGVVNHHVLESIGALEYVIALDYAIVTRIPSVEIGFFSDTLRLPTDKTIYMNLWNHFDRDTLYNIINDYMNRMSLDFDHVQNLRFKGVRNPNIIDVTQGLLEVIRGRVFTYNEIIDDIPVVLISNEFALENNLDVGDTFTVDMRWYDGDYGVINGAVNLHLRFQDYNIIWSETIELEVIGIFEPMFIMDNYANDINVYNHVSFNTMIYAPIGIVRNVYTLGFETQNLTSVNGAGYYNLYEDIVFVLRDSLDLENFYYAAQPYLPDLWIVDDLRYEYAAITNVLDEFEGISNFILIFAIISSILILGLFSILLVRERRNEFGIYLAIGDSKLKIIIRTFFEFFILSLFSISLALSIGHMFATSFTIETLTRDILNNPHVFPMMNMGSRLNDFNRMGFGVHMTAQDMFDNFDITLNLNTILMFYIITFIVIFISLSLSLIYLFKLEPNSILESKNT